jgi:hypothetical protein
MTIICYRDGIMAADGAQYMGSMRVSRMEKIICLPGGELFAATGPAGYIQRLHNWLRGAVPGPMPRTDDEGFSGLLISPLGLVQAIDCFGELFPMEAPWLAIGYPDAFARGCMAGGATAEQAVRLCLEHHDGCGGPVQVEALRP